MEKLGQLLRPGDAWTAATWNAFVLQLRRALRVKAGRGILASLTTDGLNIALAGGKDSPILLARITAIIGTTAGVAAKQDVVFYSAQAIEETGCTMTNVAPVMGRPFSAAQAGLGLVYPAALNSLCYIVRNKQPSGTVNAELWLPAGAETPKLKICGSAAAAASDPTPTPTPTPPTTTTPPVLPGTDEDLPVHGGVVGR